MSRSSSPPSPDERARRSLPLLSRPKHLPPRLPDKVAPPALVPARMVNEVLYCERLAFLEWVQGEWADNAFTVEGKHVHRRADAPGGKLPPPMTGGRAKEELPYRARSVWLSSEAFGVTAKIDIVEGDSTGRVVPIEYKRGTVPDTADGAYAPERAQLCVQALLLREHGYVCDDAAIYFAGSRRRVSIPITEELTALTLAAVARAREIASSLEAPAPLDDSPKCNGCSLVGICLPDELNLLRRLRGEPPLDPEIDRLDADDGGLEGALEPDPWGLAPKEAAASEGPADGLRRLHPSRDDRVPVYVQDPRSQIRLSGGRLVITGKDGAVHARIMNTSQVAIYGNAQISTQALRALLERGIPISFHTGGGWLVGRAVGTESKNVELRLAQYRAASDPEFCLMVARELVASKVKNCRTLLRRNHANPDSVALGQLKQLARKASGAEALDVLLGIEGSAARVYFGAFCGMFKGVGLDRFDLDGRNRRPPRDPVNALLSFAYSLLTKDFHQTIGAVGLDPLLGFLHQPRFGRPALALDLMEEFRPIIADSVVISAVNNGVVDRGSFVFTAGACNLVLPARRKVIEAYERRMDQLVRHPVFGYRISYRRVLEVQARLLGRVVLGELDQYPTFVVR